MITSKAESYSEAWRVNKSSIKHLELANALRGLRKVIGVVEPEEFSISFASRPDDASFCDANKKVIVIDPKHALNSSPIEGPDFDVLVGLSVHEAAHALLESYKAQPSRSNNDPLLQSIYTVGEEVYCDSYLRRQMPILGKYLTRSRQAYNVDANTVQWDNLIETWKAIAVYGHIPPSNAYDTEKLRAAEIALLMELSQKLMTQDFTPHDRQRLYQTFHEKLRELIRRDNVEQMISQHKSDEPPIELEGGNTSKQQLPQEPKKDDKDENKDDEPESEGADESEDEDAEGQEEDPGSTSDTDSPNDGTDGPKNTGSGSEPSTQAVEQKSEVNSDPKTVTVPTTQPIQLHPQPMTLDPELQQSIQAALDNEMEDLTNLLQETYGLSEFGGDYHTPTTIWEKATTGLDPDFNPQLALQLRWIQEFKNTIGHQVYRNEERGTIDQTRLHRAPMTNKVFKTKRVLPHQDLDLVLLVDASSSMNSNGNHKIYEDVKALFKTLPEAQVISYAAGRDNISLKLHTAGRQFRKIQAWGNTPSGLALAAVAYKYPKSLIIHFTDGESNSGIPPIKAIPKIHEQHPTVRIVTIKLDTNTSRAYHNDNIKQFEDEYPDIPGVSSRVLIRNVDEFPAALKEVLRRW